MRFYSVSIGLGSVQELLAFNFMRITINCGEKDKYGYHIFPLAKLYKINIFRGQYFTKIYMWTSL
jgi:hypothetical protein